jgi:hypothetical protein
LIFVIPTHDRAAGNSRNARICIPRTLSQSLCKDGTFQEIKSRCQQIADVREISKGEHDIPISINALERAFECPRSRLRPTLVHGLESLGRRGKHTALGQHREEQIFDRIQQNAQKGTPVSKKEIKDYDAS